MSRSRVVIQDNDKGWSKIVAEIGKADKAFVQVGVQAGDIYPETGESIADVAFNNEFGTDIIPSRPFMRQTFAKKQEEIKKHVDAEYQAVLDQKKTVEQALSLIGEWYQGEIQQEIIDGGFAPNAQSTIDKKGSSQPLIDTGRLRQSIRYVVKARK